MCLTDTQHVDRKYKVSIHQLDGSGTSCTHIAKYLNIWKHLAN